MITIEGIKQVANQGPYAPNWQSLGNFELPHWFRQAKFGIFIHWGLYSVPAFNNEWYSRNMYIQDHPEFAHHVATYGSHTEFGYKDFIPMFTAEKFDATQWAQMIKDAGAKYVFQVAEHHDGFQMYQSDLSKWNVVEMGPKQDILGELKTAFEAENLHFCASSHRAEHWFFMGHGQEFESDIKEPMVKGDFYWPAQPEPDNQDLYSEPYPSQEFLDDWLFRTVELIDKYQPELLYFDWWIHQSAAREYLKKVAAYYYNRAAEWGTEVVINYKHEAFLFGTAVSDIERGQSADMKPYFWQTDTAIALNSWCYTEHNQFRPWEDILCDLVDIVSKNGCLLLNVGPKADGTISPEDTAVLEGIGDWMRVNGEAIYGTHVWRRYGEGPTKVLEGHFTDSIRKNFTSQDFRFTAKGGCLYAIAMKASEDGRYCIRSLGAYDEEHKDHFYGIIDKAEVLGCEEAPVWQRDLEGLHLQTRYRPKGPLVFKLTLP